MLPRRTTSRSVGVLAAAALSAGLAACSGGGGTNAVVSSGEAGRPSGDESFETAEDTPLIVAQPAALLDDAGQSGGLSAVLSDDADHGVLQLAPDGSFEFEPEPDFAGVDRFRYRAARGEEMFGEATVTIRVTPLNDAPVASAVTFSVAAGGEVARGAGGLLASALDVDGDALSVAVLTEPDHGSLDWQADGSFSYRPGPDFAGADEFTYRVGDGELESDPAAVRIRYPNVVLLLVDDMGHGDLRANNPGSALELPTLDGLAASGMRFTHAHSAAALCAPSRYSLLTGNYTYRGLRDRGVWGAYLQDTMILPGQDTLADVLRAAGYRTGFLGKLHNGAAFWNESGTEYTELHDEVDFTRAFDRGPTQFGFDYSFVLPSGLSAPPYAFFENDRLVHLDPAASDFAPFDDNLEAHGRFVVIDEPKQPFNGGLLSKKGAVLDDYDSRHVGPILAHQALDFLDQHFATAAEPASPFFLYVATPAPHTPHTPPTLFDPTHPTSVDGPDGAPIAGATPVTDRTDMLLEADALLGAILERLGEQDALRNTLVLFTSDNGVPDHGTELAGSDGVGERIEVGRSANHVNPQGVSEGVPLRGVKRDVFEGGHRVPLLARWGDGTPGGSAIAPGSVSDQLVGHQDLMATLAALTGQVLGDEQGRDSFDFAPVLLGVEADAEPVRDHMIVQGSPASAGAPNLLEMDRAFYERDEFGDLWKLTVHSHVDEHLDGLHTHELFNLTRDPGEMEELSSTPGHAERVDAMFARYQELLALDSTR